MICAFVFFNFYSLINKIKNINGSDKKKIITNSPEETSSAGERFASGLNPFCAVGLSGDLGTGKTQFVKGICNYFDVKENVNSPTFTIVNEYNGSDKKSGRKISINHFDLYRIENPVELKEIGIENYIGPDSICIIEWPGLAENFFGEIIRINFMHGESENQRIIIFQE